MNRSFIFIIFFTIFLASCNHPTPKKNMPWQTLQARNTENSLLRPSIYRIQTPHHWTQKNPKENESIQDTQLPIAEFFINDTEKIRITIHTFPITTTTPSIPSLAQVQRWKNQFESLDLLSTTISKISQGGFYGLLFEGQGITDGKRTSVLAWSMQLASFYSHALDKENNEWNSYKKADYTIKAIGPTELMQKHRDAIIQFAHSFEMIEENHLPA
jgi:hypothetical protein